MTPAVEEHGVDVVAVGGGQLEPLAALLVDQLGAALGQRGGLCCMQFNKFDN